MVITSVPKYGKVPRVILPYPVKVSKNAYGKCLIAAEDLGEGEIVERYEGPIITSYSLVPEEEVRHILVIGTDHFMILESNARYINHSCDPNCDIDEDYYVVTLRPVKKGEEFSIRYNEIFPEHEGIKYFWDPRWSFKCRCGAPNCIGEISNYAVYDKPKKYTNIA